MAKVFDDAGGLNVPSRHLVIVSEPNGRQIIGYVDTPELCVGSVLIHEPLQIGEQQQGPGRINTGIAPIFHTMIVEKMMVMAASMIHVYDKSKFKELYMGAYEKIRTSISAAESGLITPDQQNLENSRRHGRSPS